MRTFRFFAPVLAIGLAGRVTLAQSHATRPPLLLVPVQDTVLIYLAHPPAGARGWLLYRGSTRLTAEPLRPLDNPAELAGRLGADLPMVMRAVKGTDEVETLRRLRVDAGAAEILLLLSPRTASVLGRFYADTGARRGMSAEYRAVPVDAFGQEKGQAITARVAVADVVPPPVTGATLSTGDHLVRLTWSYPAYGGDPRDAVIGFVVDRAEGNGAFKTISTSPVLRDELKKPVFEDESVLNGVSYRYRIRVRDIAGRETDSGPVVSVAVTDRTPPTTPTDLGIEPGERRIHIVWRSSPEADVAGYQIDRALGLNKPWTRLSKARIPAERPDWIDSTAAPGVAYFYRVIAVDSAGNASIPSNAFQGASYDRTPPKPVGSVTAHATGSGGRHGIIRWTASPSPDVRGYFVYRGDDTARLVRETKIPWPHLEYTDTGFNAKGLVPGRKYAISVSAVDSAYNESAKVPAVMIIPDSEPPLPPSAFSLKNEAGQRVTVGWVASPSLDVKEYRLVRMTLDSMAPHRATGAGKPATAARTAPAPGTYRFGPFEPDGHLSVRDTTVEPDHRYRYSLIAVDSAGNASRPVTDSVDFRDLTPPSPPHAVYASRTAKGVELRWERVASFSIAGFIVYRMPLPNGTRTRLNKAPVSGLTFIDPAPPADAFYVIATVDSSGNESIASPVAQAVKR